MLEEGQREITGFQSLCTGTFQYLVVERGSPVKSMCFNSEGITEKKDNYFTSRLETGCS
jgi:hypothetical protein